MVFRARKLSDIMKEMAMRLLRDPGREPSAEAAHAALMFASFAWNETIGVPRAHDGYRSAWETIEAENPALWNELKSNDSLAMIDELIRFKQQHYPDDRRRILVCGIVGGKLRVEWLPPAAPGVDPLREMSVYGRVRSGDREGAIRLLQETEGISRTQAARQVAAIAAKLGLR